MDSKDLKVRAVRLAYLFAPPKLVTREEALSL
jgi:hypothetical protein